MKEKKVRLNRLLITGILTILFFTTFDSFAGETQWIAVGRLHDWYHSAGCEQEVGRTFQIPDQGDGLRWPAEYKYQDVKAAKALWIGTTNYSDPLFNNVEFNYKVVHAGPRFLDEVSETMKQEFDLMGRFQHPRIFVDGVPASMLEFMETVRDEHIDPDLPSDRMIYNVVNTSIGITMTRKIYGWSRQNHNNYFILDFVFKNTGIYDNQGSIHNKTLTGVVFYWQYRYAPTREPGPYGSGGKWVPQSSSWGHSTMNDAVFTHPGTGELFRCLFTWYGEHSKWQGPGTSIGAPDHRTGGDGHFGAPQYAGTLVLQADTSPNDPTDDPNQPTTTEVLDSDNIITSAGTDQFNGPRMADEYKAMTIGHPILPHAQRVIEANLAADAYGGTPGGYSQTHGFGPYTMAPGDSIHIVIAEAVDGLDRQLGREIGAQWYANAGPFILPDGSEAVDREEFKNEWIFTGKDSLFKTLLLAKDNYESGYNIPHPPPPPDEFNVNSGGDRISLSWSNNAALWDGFAGYKIYRALFTPDTTFTEIFACGPSTPNALTNNYDDKKPIRGFDYYYYITSFDDGGTGEELESSRFYTQTNEPAFLRRPPGKSLSDIIVVPNPYNIKARELQYGIGAPDRIMFLNIPPYCTIRIFTERGDLVNTIEHTDASGDEAWNLITSSRQTVVSGVYIAHIEVTQDATDPESGAQVFKKGDNHIVKFAIVR
jgi:hypothetical protein